MMDQIKFLMLCYKAYRGDIPAGIEAYKILRSKVKQIDLLQKIEAFKK